MHFMKLQIVLWFLTLLSIHTGATTDMIKLFSLLDINGDGIYDQKEAFAALGVRKELWSRDDVLEELDMDKDGKVTIDDFMRISGLNSNYSIEQVRVALAQNATSFGSENISMTVSFSLKSTFPTCAENAFVEVLPHQLRFKATMAEYAVPSRWWEANWTGSVYTAVVQDLVPGSRINYTISACGLKRENLSIAVPFSSATDSQSLVFDNPTSIAVWGDMGTVMPLGFRVFEKIRADHDLRPFNLTHLFGDISYAGLATNAKLLNITSSDEFEFIWDLFGRQVEPLASEIPFMVSVGNHDVFYNASAFKVRYPMPKGQLFWTSYRIGDITVVSTSSEHPYGKNTPQWRWLDRVLAKARKTSPWLVLTIHRPLYSSDQNEWSQHHAGGNLQAALEPLIILHQVDLVMTGHQHMYERIHPVIDGKIVQLPSYKIEDEDVYKDPTAPPHIVVGCAGALQHEKFIVPSPQWSAVRFANGENRYTDTFGYVRIDAFNISAMHLSFETVSGGRKDGFWILKNESRPIGMSQIRNLKEWKS